MILHITYRQFKNAKQNDLWKAFSSVAGNTKLPAKMSIANFMDSWTLQAGYPVIDVTRHYENGTATITQVILLLKFIPLLQISVSI